MRYPIILLLTTSNYLQECLTYKELNEDKLICTIHISTNIDEIYKLFNYKYHILVTYFPNEDENKNENNLKKGTTQHTEIELFKKIKKILPERFYNRWIHKTQLNEPEEFTYNVNYCYVYYLLKNRINTGKPKFSCFTPSFKSYQRIQRPFDSLRNQTLVDWEWIIIDDSGDDNNEHFTYLQKFAKIEPRMRVYKRAFNSGLIGEVKNETISLCRGDYVLELDHDDTISHDLLQKTSYVFDNDKQLGFLFSDNVFQNQYKEPIWIFGPTGKDSLSMGYSAMYMNMYEEKWHYNYRSPNINNNTIRFLTCLPNHPRIWRKKSLLKIGNYPCELPICDDFEIIIRSGCFLKCARLFGSHYCQFYDNTGTNNFSWIRNSEINRIGPNFISPISRDVFNIDEHMKKYNNGEIEPFTDWRPLWQRNEFYTEKKINYVINLDFDFEIFITNFNILFDFDKENNHSKFNEIKKILENENNSILIHDIIDYEEAKDKYSSLFDFYKLSNKSIYKNNKFNYVTFYPNKEPLINQTRFFIRIFSSTKKRIIICSEEEKNILSKQYDINLMIQNQTLHFY